MPVLTRRARRLDKPSLTRNTHGTRQQQRDSSSSSVFTVAGFGCGSLAGSSRSAVLDGNPLGE